MTSIERLAELLERRCHETHDPACGCSYQEDAEWLAARIVVVDVRDVVEPVIRVDLVEYFSRAGAR